MRRKDRATGPEDALRILSTAEYGVLSMATLEGEPYGVPLNFAWADDCIYFHCAPEGRKLDLLQANPRCSFTVVGKTQVVPENFGTLYESVLVTGSAQELSGPKKQKALVLLVAKYASEHMERGLNYIDRLKNATKVFQITATSITAKACTQCTA
ncbi:pyridoxamine 5'-phosphate oxidase family protein [Desulfovibrionales bacterium]